MTDQDAAVEVAQGGPKNDSRGKREQRKRQRNRLQNQVTNLRRSIAEHRTAIHNAGTVRVDDRDQAAAEAKHRADERLWQTLDKAMNGTPIGTRPIDSAPAASPRSRSAAA